jgi:hypothetical protein
MNVKCMVTIVRSFGFLFLMVLFSTVCSAGSGERLIIVAAVKHKQFLQLYDYIRKNAKNFDPRYAGSLKTDGNPHDENKNLHITLASTDPGKKNEEICKEVLGDIEGFFEDEIIINFDSKNLRFDSDKHVIILLKRDSGYDDLALLQNRVVKLLEKRGATGIHAKDPNHVTIGFATSLYKKTFPHKIDSAPVTHARVYFWRGNGAQAYPPREEFYPKKEVRIYRNQESNTEYYRSRKGRGTHRSLHYKRRPVKKQIDR